MRYYILKGKTSVKVEMERYFCESGSNPIVNKTQIGEVEVSTVFLGADHSYRNFIEDSEPMIFETMIFGGVHNDYKERYSTWEQAEQGHDKSCEMVRSTVN